jgi:hypothetical protein
MIKYKIIEKPPITINNTKQIHNLKAIKKIK